MNYLAHSYRLNGDTENADKTFLAIVEAFPGSRRATNAVEYLSESARAQYEAGTFGDQDAVSPQEDEPTAPNEGITIGEGADQESTGDGETEE
jgi:Flp pilus assembly protein TadD